MAEAEESTEAAEKKGGNKLVIILMVVIIVLLLAVGGVVTWLLLSKSGSHASAGGDKATAEHTEKSADKKHKGAPTSIPLGQPITVNLNKPNDADLLQVQLTLVTYDTDVDKLVKDNRAEIINDIMLILSDVKAANLRTREGKEKLQKQIKDEVNKVLLKYSGKKDMVDNVFFTKLLMQ